MTPPETMVERVAPFEEIAIEAYRRGWSEAVETVRDDYPHVEPPHKDCMGEGCGMFMGETWPKLRAAIEAMSGEGLQDTGASADADRACGPSDPSRVSPSRPEALVPSADDVVSRLCDLHTRFAHCWQIPGGGIARRPRFFEPQWKDMDTVLDAAVALDRKSAASGMRLREDAPQSAAEGEASQPGPKGTPKTRPASRE